MIIVEKKKKDNAGPGCNKFILTTANTFNPHSNSGLNLAGSQG